MLNCRTRGDPPPIITFHKDNQEPYRRGDNVSALRNLKKTYNSSLPGFVSYKNVVIIIIIIIIIIVFW